MAPPPTAPPPEGGAATRPRAPEPRAPGPPGRLAAVIALSVVVVVGAALAGPWDPRTREEPLLPWSPPAPTDLPIDRHGLPNDLDLVGFADRDDVQPWDLRWLGLLLLAVLIAWIVLGIMRWAQRHPVALPPEAPDDAGLGAGAMLRGPGVVQPDLPALREGVAGADLIVRRHVRATDAIVAAWVHLETAAARTGIPRQRSQTPTEFTVAVLDSTPVDPAATRVLLDLYLRARFGGERMTAGDVGAAVAALGTLADGLGDPSAAVLDEVDLEALQLDVDPDGETDGETDGAPDDPEAPR